MAEAQVRVGFIEKKGRISKRESVNMDQIQADRVQSDRYCRLLQSSIYRPIGRGHEGGRDDCRALVGLIQQCEAFTGT